MDHATVDSVTRRASMFSLAAALASPLAAGAKTTAKKFRKKQRQKCQAQVARCETFLTADCKGDPACLATRPPCCTLLDTCDFPAFLACLV